MQQGSKVEDEKLRFGEQLAILTSFKALNMDMFQSQLNIDEHHFEAKAAA